MNIIIKTPEEIEKMRDGGHRLAGIMDEIEKAVRPGQNTHEIDELARRLIFDIGGIPIFEGYGGPENPYPGAVCASVNHEVVHGIPRKDRVLKEGDLLKIDIGMKYRNLITDMARTFPVGKVTTVAWKLMKVTKESLNVGIGKLKAGAKLFEYSQAVESYVRSNGFSVIRELVGHGVGHELHEDPQIPNYKSNEKDIILKEGMTLALEPMINVGTEKIRLEKDGWTYVTADGKLSAHFEDTVAITKGGCEILTRK
jgi:methionyl aminopeptidase